MPADRAHPLCEILVLTQNGAAITITAQRFGRIETGRRDLCNITDPAPLILAAKSLRAVCDDAQSMRISHRLDGRIVGWQAIQIDRHDGARGQPTFRFDGINLPGEVGGIHVERLGVNIDNHRIAA